MCIRDSIDSLTMSEVNCIGYCIGNCQADWQKEIFKNVLSGIEQEAKNRYLGILAKSLWRSRNLIWQIDRNKVNDILQLLLIKTQAYIAKKSTYYGDHLEAMQRLELLFALLRFRKKYQILNPNDERTMEFIDSIDKIYFKFKEQKYIVKSYLEFKIKKPQMLIDVPDLLYATRMYLMGDNEAVSGIQILGLNEE